MQIIIDITDNKPTNFIITQGTKTVKQRLTDEPAKEIDDILNTPLKDLISDYTQFLKEI